MDAWLEGEEGAYGSLCGVLQRRLADVGKQTGGCI